MGRMEKNGCGDGRTRTDVGKDGRAEGRAWGRTDAEAVGGTQKSIITYAIIFGRNFQRSISRGFRSIAPPCRQNTPEHIVLDVGEGLTRRDDDRLARVDPQRIHVLHVAHRDAIPRAITHNLRGRSTQ